jgi:hypothetical protein
MALTDFIPFHVFYFDRFTTQKVVFELSASSQNSWGWQQVERLELYPNANPYK